MAGCINSIFGIFGFLHEKMGEIRRLHRTRSKLPENPANRESLYRTIEKGDENIRATSSREPHFQVTAIRSRIECFPLFRVKESHRIICRFSRKAMIKAATLDVSMDLSRTFIDFSSLSRFTRSRSDLRRRETYGVSFPAKSRRAKSNILAWRNVTVER